MHLLGFLSIRTIGVALASIQDVSDSLLEDASLLRNYSLGSGESGILCQNRRPISDKFAATQCR